MKMKDSIPQLNRSTTSTLMHYNGAFPKSAGWSVDFNVDDRHIFTIEYTYVNGWLNMFEAIINRHPEHEVPKNLYVSAYFDITENILAEKHFRKISDGVWQLPLPVAEKSLTYGQFEKMTNDLMKEINNKLRGIV